MEAWIAVSIIGRDRPGIVAGFSKVLYQNQCNIEELSQAAIRGQFAMILIASTAAGERFGALQKACEQLGRELDLNINLRKIGSRDLVPYDTQATEPFIITVWGQDRPGLVSGITEVLAESGINITNLDAKTAQVGEETHYIQLFGVDIPKGLDYDRIQEKLQERGRSMGVTVNLQHRDIFQAMNKI
jgi:glycine cleavage system transcriptional repressor